MPSIIDTGKDLLTIKDRLGHGKFGPWLEFHFSMTERTAENYMNAASAFSSSPKILDLLPITTIYKLAAKSTPDAVRQAIVGDLAGGSKMHQSDVEARIAEAKEEERRKHVEERERLAAIDAWNKHEKNMRASGKVDDEIEAERKRWDTKKARAERVKEKKVAAAKANEEQSRLEQQKLEAERERMRQRAERVAEILRKKLGSDFDTFRALIGRFVYPEFRDAFEKL